MRLTKIVSTIWLKTEKEGYLSELIDAWINVMRLNFSHWDYEEHWNRIKTLRKLIKEKWKKVAILLDTKWPEIRTWKLKNWEKIFLEKWKNIILTTEELLWDEKILSVNYNNLHNELKQWDIVLLDDWLIKLEVLNINWNNINCKIINSWKIASKRWVNIPDVNIQLPILSEKDKNDIIRWCKQWVHFIALSFVRNKEDVKVVRDLLNKNWWEKIKIISKIENKLWIENFDEILEYSDWIMVARWDLWVEIPIYKIPIIQKKIIEKTVHAWKIVITATQMLESMINNPRPTRAEATDVANAVFDWTDAVMLSWETAKSDCKYPVEAVKMMSKIVENVDNEIDWPNFDVKIKYNWNDDIFSSSIAKWAVETSRHINSKLIVVRTNTWKTTQKIRKFFPKIPILVLTPNEIVMYQSLLIRWVIDAEIIWTFNSYQEFCEYTKNTIIKKWLVSKWDNILIVWWWQCQNINQTDMFKIVKI